MSRYAIGILVLLTLAGARSVSAGAWTQEEGTAYIKLTYSYLTASESFDADGDSIDGDFQSQAVWFYAEYGLLDNLTLVTSGPLFQTLDDGLSGASDTVALAGDWTFQARFRLLQDPVVLSIQAGVKVPIGYSLDDQPPLGTGEVDVDARLQLGVPLPFLQGWLSAEVGYRNRQGEFDDQLFFAFQAGVRVTEFVTATIVSDGVLGLGSSSADLGARFNVSEDNLRVGGGLIFDLPLPLSPSLDVTYYYTPAGRNTLEAHAVFVGVAITPSLPWRDRSAGEPE